MHINLIRYAIPDVTKSSYIIIRFPANSLSKSACI